MNPKIREAKNEVEFSYFLKFQDGTILKIYKFSRLIRVLLYKKKKNF